MKIALLGAGRIGQAIAATLAATNDYQVTVADRDDQALTSLAPTKAHAQQLDIDNLDALQRFLKQHDAVVNALPFQAAIAVADAACASGVHYFDLTEDVASTQHIAALAKQSDTAFMPQCGLAPGFAGIAAHALTQQFDRLDQVKIRVGALPQFPNNALKYNPTWSLEGLVNEYCQPCDVIQDGLRQQAAALEGVESLIVDGVQYEAFNTSGGLGTLCDTLEGKVRQLDYKSIRYPGHATLARFLIQDLQLGSKPQLLVDLLRDTLPQTRQDMVVIFIAVTGWKDGHKVQDVFTRTIKANKTTQVKTTQPTTSAIQIATTAGVCAVIDLFREGKLPTSGFIGQEAVNLDDFLTNRFGRVYG